MSAVASIRPPVAILGVRFDNLSMREAIERVETMVGSGKPHYAVTANVDFLVQARGDVELRRLLFDAHLVLCDGTPLVWASRLLGEPLPERCAGADIVPRLIEVAALKKHRLFFLGATPESARMAAERVSSRHPDIVIAGHYSPPFRQLLEMDHEEITRRVREAHPDLLFVSFGCPKQEKWIGMHYRQLGVPVTIGVGATIDFLAGQVRRAPAWMQRAGIEWLFRLAQEPRRLFKRYATDLGVFGLHIWRQWWMFRPGGKRNPVEQTGPLAKLSEEPPFELPAVLDRRAVEAGSAACFGLVETRKRILIDARFVRRLDSVGMGFLMDLQRTASVCGHSVVWIGPSHAVAKALRFMRLERFFTFAPDTAAALARLQESQRAGGAVTCSPGHPPRVAWHGEVTALNAEEVWRETSVRFSAEPVSREWVLDLAAVPFIDSSGLGVILRAKKLALASGTDLRLLNLCDPVQNVVRLARLEAFLINSGSNGTHAAGQTSTGVQPAFAGARCSPPG